MGNGRYWMINTASAHEYRDMQAPATRHRDSIVWLTLPLLIMYFSRCTFRSLAFWRQYTDQQSMIVDCLLTAVSKHRFFGAYDLARFRVFTTSNIESSVTSTSIQSIKQSIILNKIPAPDKAAPASHTARRCCYTGHTHSLGWKKYWQHSGSRWSFLFGSA